MHHSWFLDLLDMLNAIYTKENVTLDPLFLIKANHKHSLNWKLHTLGWNLAEWVEEEELALYVLLASPSFLPQYKHAYLSRLEAGKLLLL